MCEIKARDWRGIVRDMKKGLVYTHKDNKHFCFLNALHKDWLPSQHSSKGLRSNAVTVLEAERPTKKVSFLTGKLGIELQDPESYSSALTVTPPPSSFSWGSC